jgi:hypothetical protein
MSGPLLVDWGDDGACAEMRRAVATGQRCHDWGPADGQGWRRCRICESRCQRDRAGRLAVFEYGPGAARGD